MATIRTPAREKDMTKDTDTNDRRKTFSKLHIEGKVDKMEKYRKEKPMEFCSHCDLHVNQGIACENCNYWYHPECEKVAPDEYDFLVKNEVTTSLWYCKICREELADLAEKSEALNRDYKKMTKWQEENSNLKKENELLKKEKDDMKDKAVEKERLHKDHKRLMQYEEENKSLKEENETLKKENGSLKERVMYIEEEVKNIKGGLGNSSQEPMMNNNTMVNMFKEIIVTFKEEANKDRRMMIDEIKKIKEDRETLKEEVCEVVTKQMRDLLEERSRTEEKRREEEKEEMEIREKQNNLIVFNVEEPREGMEERDKVEEEYRKIDQIFGRGVGVRGFNVLEVKRLGIKSERKIRPMLVKMERSEQKWDIVRNAKNLSRAKYPMKRVGIVPDLTRKQRERDRQLRDRLQEKRDRGESGWFINRGELKRRVQENIGEDYERARRNDEEASSDEEDNRGDKEEEREDEEDTRGGEENIRSEQEDTSQRFQNARH